MKKRILAALLCIVLICALSVSVFGANKDVPDPARKGTISVKMVYEEKPVPGGSLTIYKVANVDYSRGDYFFKYTDEYAECTASLEALDDATTAKAMADYTAEKAIVGNKKNIDNNGELTFDEVEIGLYLVIQENPGKNFKKINPFLISMPQRSGDVYIYELDASPKLSLEPAPPTPTPSTSVPPWLPQTGQLNWPVPILAIAGLFLVVIGITVRANTKNRHED